MQSPADSSRRGETTSPSDVQDAEESRMGANMRPATMDSSTDAATLGQLPEAEARIMTLESIQGVNTVFLDLLWAGAQAGVPGFPFDEPLRSRIAALSDRTRKRLSQCGVLLVDACFAQAQRWRLIASEELRSDSALNHWLPEKEGMLLVHSVLHIAWSVLKWNRQEAAFLLGVSTDTARSIQALNVQDLSRIAKHRSHWIRPRWADRPNAAWAKLIELVETSRADDSSPTLRALTLSMRLRETEDDFPAEDSGKI